jgi:hypothetical protein
MNSALRAFYAKTVRPVTGVCVVVSVYSNGYNNGVDWWVNDRRMTVIPFLMGLIKSAVIGSCIGITYPVSIPAVIALDYMEYREDREKDKDIEKMRERLIEMESDTKN